MRQRKKFYVSFLAVMFFLLFSFQAVHASSGAVLENGMKSEAVLRLQRDLKALKYLDAEPTGYYGNLTVDAVMEFQKEYGLKADGIAGPKTLAKLDGIMGRSSAAASAASSGRSASVSRGDAKRLSIVDYAKRFLGVGYVWGGTTPKGFDCSGFVKYVFQKFGIVLNRVSREMALQGTRVKKSELKPGDLVFFDTNGGRNSINHVGIYIGGGRFIQSSSEKNGVVISDITDGFYANTYMTARRVF